MGSIRTFDPWPLLPGQLCSRRNEFSNLPSIYLFLTPSTRPSSLTQGSRVPWWLHLSWTWMRGEPRVPFLTTRFVGHCVLDWGRTDFSVFQWRLTVFVVPVPGTRFWTCPLSDTPGWPSPVHLLYLLWVPDVMGTLNPLLGSIVPLRGPKTCSTPSLVLCTVVRCLRTLLRSSYRFLLWSDRHRVVVVRRGDLHGRVPSPGRSVHLYIPSRGLEGLQ